MEIKLGDVVSLRKKHPCGSYTWQVIRIGADIGISCLKCGRHVLLERSTFERRVKAFLSKKNNATILSKFLNHGPSNFTY